MTPADICDACSGCRSIHECRRKCGLDAEAEHVAPPPPSRKRQAVVRLLFALTVLLSAAAFGLPIWSLASVG